MFAVARERFRHSWSLIFASFFIKRIIIRMIMCITSAAWGAARLDVTMACDIMLDLEGSIRPAMHLANELVRRGHNVSIVSPLMSKDVVEHLRAGGIEPLSLGARFATKRMGPSVIWFEAWAREAFLRLNSKRVGAELPVTINFSQVFSVPSTVWYLQGPASLALRDMKKELSARFRFFYDLFRPVIDYVDEVLVSQMGRRSQIVIANSVFCASMYSQFGVKASEVIYPAVDCAMFRPSTSKPSSEYVLAYIGKETRFSVLRSIVDKGVKVKAFGSKIPFFISSVHKDLTKRPNIEMLGRVSTDELVELYSNALFTLVPFSHEPFGYVPLESMACGTPPLTYGMQGPGEYVTDEYTGWLAHTDDEIVTKAVQLWKEGYDLGLRKNCLEAASKLDKSIYLSKFLKVLDNL